MRRGAVRLQRGVVLVLLIDRKRRGSVLWRCTTYITQPGSLRDSSVNLEKTAATSASRPTFAIQVTARTTIMRSVFRIVAEASVFCPVNPFSSAVKPSTNIVCSRPGPVETIPMRAPLSFSRKCQVVARRLRQFVHVGDRPAWKCATPAWCGRRTRSRHSRCPAPEFPPSPCH